MKTISLKVDDSVFDQVSRIAERSHKSRPEIVRESIQARLEYEVWLEHAVEAAREDVRRGRTVSHKEAMHHLNEIREQIKARD